MPLPLSKILRPRKRRSDVGTMRDRGSYTFAVVAVGIDKVLSRHKSKDAAVAALARRKGVYGQRKLEVRPWPI